MADESWGEGLGQQEANGPHIVKSSACADMASVPGVLEEPTGTGAPTSEQQQQYTFESHLLEPALPA
ncbi:hypothetical protein MRX96_044178 [Rhipicephalus microplus]